MAANPTVESRLVEQVQEALRAYQQQQFSTCRTLCQAILTDSPHVTDAHYLLGMAAFREGLWAEAKAGLETTIDRVPTHVDALHVLGEVYQKLGDTQAAEHAYQQVLQARPDYYQALNNLGVLYKSQGQFQKAAEAFHQVLALQPSLVEVWNNLGMTQQQLQDLDAAERSYRKAISTSPQFAPTYAHLANLFYEQNRIEDALHYYDQALALDPKSASTWSAKGTALKADNQYEAAKLCYDKALHIDPTYIQALWGRCLMLPKYYQTEAEIDAVRTAYSQALDELIEKIDLSTPDRIQQAADIVGSHQPFYLPYQGRDDKDLQTRYGQLVSRIMGARYPQWSKPRPMPALTPQEKIKVGIVSRYFNAHSNWKIPIRGWAMELDRSQFEVYGYSTGGPVDKATREARTIFDQFTEDLSQEALCQKIVDDALHVLIFPEIGMDGMTLRMAGLRLAPVQASSWGHPQTSGMPTLDYFLSSDLMEAPEAQDYYSETLVRLPNLSIHYEATRVPPVPFDWTDAGVNPSGIHYLCTQSLCKYLPQYDWVFPKIAAQVPQAQFLFIDFRGVGPLMEARLQKAFDDAGVSMAGRVVFLPRLNAAQFAYVCSQGHIFLDSLGWSGCNSTMETLEHSKPVVTTPGRFMRERHSAAILEMMGLHHRISPTIEAYVAQAVALGNDPSLREAYAQEIVENRHKLYFDTQSVRGLEAFLKKVVQERV